MDHQIPAIKNQCFHFPVFFLGGCCWGVGVWLGGKGEEEIDIIIEIAEDWSLVL